MAFWVAAMTFIVSLFVYMMYPRSDHLQLEKPRAEGVIVSFVDQHQAARNYMLQFLTLTAAEKNIGTTSLYKISPKIERFMPYSATLENYQNEDKMNPETGYVSALACLSSPNARDLSASCAPSDLKYIITYGYPQDWWPNDISNKELWKRAILKRAKGTPDCGTIYPKNEYVGFDRSYLVNTTQKLARSIPVAISKALISEGMNFSSGDLNTEPLEGVLFCISPFNQPYETEGLLVHYDAINNTGSGHDNAAIGTTGEWVNLNTLYSSSSESSLNEKGNALLHNFSFLDTTAGLKFTENQYIQTINERALGNNFTISYIIEPDASSIQNKTTMTFLKGGISGNYLNHQFDASGFNLKIATATNVITAPLSYFLTSSNKARRVAVTYVVQDLTLSSAKYSLYINGQKISEGTKSALPSGLADGTLTIGSSSGNGFKGILYNFKLYNKALTSEQVEKNFQTDNMRYGPFNQNIGN